MPFYFPSSFSSTIFHFLPVLVCTSLLLFSEDYLQRVFSRCQLPSAPFLSKNFPFICHATFTIRIISCDVTHPMIQRGFHLSLCEQCAEEVNRKFISWQAGSDRNQSLIDSYIYLLYYKSLVSRLTWPSGFSLQWSLPEHCHGAANTLH